MLLEMRSLVWPRLLEAVAGLTGAENLPNLQAEGGEERHPLPVPHEAGGAGHHRTALLEEQGRHAEAQQRPAPERIRENLVRDVGLAGHKRLHVAAAERQGSLSSTPEIGALQRPRGLEAVQRQVAHRQQRRLVSCDGLQQVHRHDCRVHVLHKPSLRQVWLAQSGRGNVPPVRLRAPAQPAHKGREVSQNQLLGAHRVHGQELQDRGLRLQQHHQELQPQRPSLVVLLAQQRRARLLRGRAARLGLEVRHEALVRAAGETSRRKRPIARHLHSFHRRPRAGHQARRACLQVELSMVFRASRTTRTRTSTRTKLVRLERSTSRRAVRFHVMQ